MEANGTAPAEAELPVVPTAGATSSYRNNADQVYKYAVRDEGADRDGDLKRVAREIMAGEWREFKDGDMSVTQISSTPLGVSLVNARHVTWLVKLGGALTPLGGGITNLLYKISGPGGTATLARIYGVNTEVIIDRERDNRLFAELARLGFAPTLHGRFSNGRLEGYLPARPLEPGEMRLRAPIDYPVLIGRELGRMHRLPITCAGPQDQGEFWSTLKKWLDMARGVVFEDEAKAAAQASLNLDRVEQEITWLRRQLVFNGQDKGAEDGTAAAPASMANGENGGSPPSEPRDSACGEGPTEVPAKGCGNNSRARAYLQDVVYCHQDLLSGNIIHAEGWDRVQIIDYEYSGYNCRGFDIANHFCEHAGFDSDFENGYPAAETQLAFLEAYLGAASPELIGQAADAFLAELQAECGRWAPAAHLFWGIWSVIQARYSPIDFDFLDYALLRLAGYALHKRRFFPGAEGAGAPEASGGGE